MHTYIAHSQHNCMYITVYLQTYQCINVLCVCLSSNIPELSFLLFCILSYYIVYICTYMYIVHLYYYISYIYLYIVHTYLCMYYICMFLYSNMCNYFRFNFNKFSLVMSLSFFMFLFCFVFPGHPFGREFGTEQPTLCTYVTIC